MKMNAHLLQQGTVHGALARFIVAFCTHEQLVVPAVCHSYAPNDRIPFNVWLNILQDIAKQDTRPALGLAIAKFAILPHGGILAYLALSCRTLGEAMQRYSHFHRLAYDGNGLELMFRPDGMVEIIWGVAAGRPGQLADETGIGALSVLLRQLIAPHDFKFNEVHFINTAPKIQQPYRDFFGCPVYFEANNTMVSFHQDQLNLPLLKQDDALREILEQQAAVLFAELPHYDSFDVLLQETLIKAIHAGQLGIESVAQQLGLSERKLQRKLIEKGYTFQTRLNQVRNTMAQQYLHNNTMTLSEIALLLGYSEQSAFQRAFKQWTGITPAQFRRQAQGL